MNNIAGRVTSIIMNVVLLAIGGQNAVSVYGILMTMDGFVHPCSMACATPSSPRWALTGALKT